MGARLIVVKPEEAAGAEYVVRPDRPARLGRDRAACEIHIADAAASRVHAQVECSGQRWILTDLESSNGLFLNGARVRRTAIADGDLLQVGSHVLRFSLDVPVSPVATEAQDRPAPGTRPDQADRTAGGLSVPQVAQASAVTPSPAVAAPEALPGAAPPLPAAPSPTTEPQDAPAREEQARQPDVLLICCPGCTTRLRLPLTARGRLVRCLVCQLDFAAPATGAPAVAASGRAPEPGTPRATGAAPAVPTSGPAAPAAPPPRTTGPRDGTGAVIPAEARKPAPPPAPAGPAASAAAPYPWLPSPAQLARTAALRQAREGMLCQGEAIPLLNRPLKHETFRKGAPPVQLRIVPGLVVAEEAPEKPGCAVAFVQGLPEPLRLVFGPLCMIPFLILSPFSLLGTVFEFCLGVLFFPFVYLHLLYLRAKLRRVAERVRREPHSSYAVRMLHRLSPVVPRCWEAGEVSQVIRIQARKGLRSCGFVLLVQGRPLTRSPGCASFGILLLLNRRVAACSRIYVLRLRNPGTTEQVAAAVAQALGVRTVDQGTWRFNNFFLAGPSGQG